MSISFKRIFAFLIDWVTILFPFVIIILVLSKFLVTNNKPNPIMVYLSFFIIIAALVAFVLRDVIFKGRSLGKRIFELNIYDQRTRMPASVKQRIKRNIFIMIYPIDGIVLLATGTSIGDRVANTVVASRNSFLNQPNLITKKQRIRNIILIVAVFVCFALVLAGIIKSVLNAKKDTPEYKAAYSYFVASNTFKELNIAESEIQFNTYSLQTQSSKNNNSVKKTVRIGFSVNFKSFEVICHEEDGQWKVCDECTEFE